MAASIQNKLKELEKQNRLLTDNLLDAVWVMNAGTLVYEYITPSIYEISGYTADELINTSIADRLLPESLRKASELLEASIRGYEQGIRESKSIELELLHKNGDTYWIEVRAKLMEDPGSPLKIVGTTRNITARKKAELKLKKRNQQLSDTLAEKERLLKEIKVLRGLLPICAACKRIRDEHGKWWPLDAYVEQQTEAELTHTVCPDCKDVIYPAHSK
jgi:PAS domain S-box-containing protein